MQPTTAQTTYRPDLGGAFEEFDVEADREGYIAHRVMPVLDVNLPGDSWGKITLESMLEDRETQRASGGAYARGTYRTETDTYATKENGAEEPIDDRNRKRYKHFMDAELNATRRARGIVLRNQEKRVADMTFNATTYTGASLTTAITNEWDDDTNATPIADVEAAVNKVWENTGLWPNALIINRKVFRNLRNVAEIIDRVKYSGHVDPRPGKITQSVLAEVFDLRHIIVAGGAKNIANEGQDASIASIWSNEYAMVARVAETDDIQEPCLGRIFHWDEDGSEPMGHIETYREENIRSDIYRCRHETDEKMLYVACGHLLSNITT